MLMCTNSLQKQQFCPIPATMLWLCMYGASVVCDTADVCCARVDRLMPEFGSFTVSWEIHFPGESQMRISISVSCPYSKYEAG